MCNNGLRANKAIIMKSNILCAVVLAAVSLTAACTGKDWAYTPKGEIEKVYYSSEVVDEIYNAETDRWETVNTSSTPKVLTETWNWDDNLLRSIVFNGESNTSGQDRTAYFSYSQKRISLIETEDQRIVFTYSGRNLSKAEMFDKRHDTDRAFLSYYFKYEDKKLSRIEVMSPGATKSQLATPLQQRWMAYMHEAMGVPAMDMDKVCRKAADTKEEIVEIMKLMWSGGNVSSVTIESDYGSQKVDYTYDTKNNPYSHFLYTLGSIYAGEGIEFANQNNITKVVTTYMSDEMEEEAEEQTEVIYHYTYQNDWPVVKQRVQVYGDEQEGSRVTERSFNYYEYDD